MRQRSLVLLTAVLLTACSTPAITMSGSASASRSTQLKLSVSSPLVGESFKVSGYLPTSGKRSFDIQYRDGYWKKLRGATSSSTGTYKVSVKMPTKVTALRVVAKAATVSGTKRSKFTSSTFSVRPGTPKSYLKVLPGIAQQGSAPANSTKAKDVVVASFSPVRPGKAVVIEQDVNGTWTQVKTLHQDSRGTVTTKVTAGQAWRARTSRWPVAKQTKDWTNSLTTEFTGLSGTSLPAPWKTRYPGFVSANRKCTVSTTGSQQAGTGSDTGTVKLLNSIAYNGTGALAGCSKYVQYGHVGTGDTGGFRFTHGVAAARIKFSSKQGQHGAFWLQSNDPDGSEVDIIEYYGARDDGGVSNTVHYKANGRAKKDSHIATNWKATLAGSTDSFSKNYHVFSVEWTAKEYIFRIDGVETYRTSRGLSSKPEFLVLSNSTGEFELPTRFKNRNTEQMKVDWVKVWQ